MTKYDVVIIGGGTSGISCAWNSAKLGLKTLLVEEKTFLGGSITSSLVIPAMKTSENSINNDFFLELYKNLEAVNGAITYIDGNKGWYNPELTKIVLDNMLTSVGVEILFESSISKIEQTRDLKLLVYIDSIGVNNISSFENVVLLPPIETSNLVDATGDAKICEKLNCKFINKIFKDENKFQPVSLRFILSGINTKQFSDWLLEYDPNREVTTSSTIDSRTYLSTAYTWDSNIKWALKPLFERALANNELNIEDTNYFQLFSVAGTPDSIAFNAPRIINTNLTRTQAYIEGRASIFRLYNFCKNHLPGFENSYISSIANSLGVRVSNRVLGEYIYTYEDLVTGKKFDNPVLISNYPVDIHSPNKDDSILEKRDVEYQLPLESLMVKDFKNLFVIGRCISADFKAQAALRIIPSCFSMGEGLAKHLYKNK